MTKRLLIRAAAMGTAGLMALGLTPAAHAAFPGANGRIAFETP